jgi:hypothetical protein
MTSFFYGIENLFVNHLFWPLDQLRYMHSWWGSNWFNCILFLVGAGAFIYWVMQLQKFGEKGQVWDVETQTYR